MKTNLFIAGFAKCGTTSLYQMLLTSDQISGGTSKEPAYFSTLKGKTATNSLADWSVSGRYDRGLDWYQRIFPNGESAYQLDASTIYAFDPATPALIHQYNPAARFIFVVREPYSRIESHYFQEVKTGLDLPPFAEFIASDHPRLRFYKEATRYKRTLLRFQPYFADDSVLVLSLPMLKELDLLQEKLSNFLGSEITLAAARAHTVSNKRKAARLPLLKKALIAVERSRLAHQSPRWLQEAGSRLFRGVDRVLLREVQDTPQIAPQIKARIRAEFEEDLSYLKQNHGVGI